MRVLIATGGPDQTDISLRQLTILGESVSINPTVLTVIKQSGEQAIADNILKHAAEILDPVFDQVHYKTRVGRPWEEIVRESKSGDYDLLMMGQRRSRSLLTRLRGIVTQKVVTETSLPVLIAKKQVVALKRILICDSGVRSPSLLQLFHDNLPKILTQATEVTVLHVMSQILAAPGIDEQDLQASAEELIRSQTPEGIILAQNMAFLEDLGLKVEAKIRHGLVIDEIVDEAKSEDYDLVVIGTRRGSNMPRFLLDDLARELVLDVNRPILVVR
jgi:nucleotide-binding universal stress UspA family protein